MRRIIFCKKLCVKREHIYHRWDLLHHARGILCHAWEILYHRWNCFCHWCNCFYHRCNLFYHHCNCFYHRWNYSYHRCNCFYHRWNYLYHQWNCFRHRWNRVYHQRKIDYHRCKNTFPAAVRVFFHPKEPERKRDACRNAEKRLDHVYFVLPHIANWTLTLHFVFPAAVALHKN